jgi:hypothetical protein
MPALKPTPVGDDSACGQVLNKPKREGEFVDEEAAVELLDAAIVSCPPYCRRRVQGVADWRGMSIRTPRCTPLLPTSNVANVQVLPG